MVGGGSIATLNFVRGGSFETVIRSCCPGVTEWSENTRTFENFSGGFLFAEVWTTGSALPIAGTTAIATVAATPASRMLPLPEDTA